MRQHWHHLVAESQNPGENPLQISTWPIPTTGLLSVYSSWNMQRAPFLHDREWTTTELANAAVLIAVAGVSLATVSLTSRRLRYTRNVNRRFSVRPFYQSWAAPEWLHSRDESSCKIEIASHRCQATRDPYSTVSLPKSRQHRKKYGTNPFQAFRTINPCDISTVSHFV